jgi:hypothetical protein
MPDWSALPALKRSALRQWWRALFNAPMPAKASRELVIYCLAYRIQQNAYGGLSAKARQRLRPMAQPLAREPGPAKPAAVRLAPGTRLIRQWRGQRHEVSVLERFPAPRRGKFPRNVESHGKAPPQYPRWEEAE